MANHTQAVQGVLVADWDALEGRPGAFLWADNDGTLVCCCPCGCEQLWAIPVRDRGDGRVFWAWDGNRTAPSLHPSIRDVGGCRWHGHLKAGVWHPAGDSGRR